MFKIWTLTCTEFSADSSFKRTMLSLARRVMFLCLGLSIIFISFREFIIIDPDVLMEANITFFNGVNRSLNSSDIIFNMLWYAPPQWLLETSSVSKINNCKYENCVVLLDRNMISKSHLVLFHHSNMEVPAPVKYRNQKWVFVSLEVLKYTSKFFKVKQWLNMFDMTMSYRSDSEGYSPYGKIIRRTEMKTRNYTDIFLKKSKDVAWVVSSCKSDSRREEYVEQMRRIIDVDIYGKCGIACGEQEGSCFKPLSKRYKFYLSFETSICEDYISEKLYRIFDEDTDLIPVARGAPNVKAFIPEGTFISTEDFRSPQELAYYLKHLGNNMTRYITFLKTKDQYVTKGGYRHLIGMCSLCEKLNKGQIHKNLKSMDLLSFMSKKQCIPPKDI